MGKRVAIVGAGYAGMAAAVTLAERGASVTVFESGPVPGGRARRVATEGRELDNGQHILIGAYTEVLRLMRLVGVPSSALLRMPIDLRYADGFRLKGAAGLLLSSKIPFRERVDAIRFMLWLKRKSFRLVADMSVNALLQQHRQNGVLGHYVWRPLCVSALNTPPEQASAQVFATVLRNSLAAGPGASDLLLPCVDLSRLFPEPAADYLGAHGGELRTNSPVRDLAALRTDFSSIIVAVGPHQLKTLLPEIAPEYAYQPIYTCYLQYPQEAALPCPMLGFADGLVQWAFDRSRLTGERGLIACVISAQGDHQQMAQEELAATCHRELKAALPGLPDPQWSRVIAEKRATIACVAGIKKMGFKKNARQIFLAGDYLDPDYPPTLEAAVRSGIRAAAEITRRQ
ncbi:MAG TPA: hydroxysqualene dehydroxylase HpnE [Burkholderiales bacterium]|nr:hydroxysqualene dehydroxylase HpnE [Burkholderiales bacterium]